MIKENESDIMAAGQQEQPAGEERAAAGAGAAANANRPPGEEARKAPAPDMRDAEKSDEAAQVDEHEKEVSALRDQLEAERGQRSEAEDRILRLRADFDNLRRRTLLEAEQLKFNLSRDILLRFLPVIDDLDRALDQACGEAPPSWIEGIEMVRRRFLAALSEQGLERFDSTGKPFDPEKHEAMLRVEDSGQPSSTVVEELRPGYTLGGRVIRPALVKVQA